MSLLKTCVLSGRRPLRKEVRDGLLIRRSPQYIYINKIDRLSTWRGNLLGGHEPPPAELAKKT